MPTDGSALDLEPRAGRPDLRLAKRHLDKLLKMGRKANEEDVKYSVRAALESLFPNYPVLGEKYVGQGRADLICSNIIVETKSPGLNPRSLASPQGRKSAERQAKRYLASVSLQQKLFRNSPWRCVVTNGLAWLFYQYDMPKHQRHSGTLHLEEKIMLADSNDANRIIQYLRAFVDTTAPPPPPIGAAWVGDLKAAILQQSRKQKSSSGFQSKRNLWALLLRGSHIIPPTNIVERNNLFAKHTLLIIIAKSVREELKPADFRTPISERHKLMEDDFASWLHETSSGTALVKEIIRAVSQYDWRTAGRDALKELYHNLIENRLRHDFGEFYTPDWLARLVCEEVLDPGWCKKAIKSAKLGKYKHVVFDPSCGSGTFLFHACRRLLEFAQDDPELAGNPNKQAEIVSELVYGIDIHPVAAELAKATKLAALPSVPLDSGSFGVYIGDSLQWDATKIAGIFGEMIIIPVGKDKTTKHVRFPAEFLLGPDFEKNLATFFDVVQMPSSKFDPDLVKPLARSQNTRLVGELTAACKFFHSEKKAGRNHVWKTYLTNMVQPFRMERSVDRMIGNPPWVTSRGMDKTRKEDFRVHAKSKGVWSGGKLAPTNDLSATFVASCVEYYLTKNAKFGFLLPHAALISDQWEKFRTGAWANSVVKFEKAVDLSKITDPPFPTSASSYFTGTYVGQFAESHAAHPARSGFTKTAFNPRHTPGISKQKEKPKKPMRCGITILSATGIKSHMQLDQVRPLLRSARKTAPPKAGLAQNYAVSMGANLQPHPLIVCDSTNNFPAYVAFSTKPGRDNWNKVAPKQSLCKSEPEFVHKALFSQQLVPFGFHAPRFIIAPFKNTDIPGMRTISAELPLDDSTKLFRAYWLHASVLYSKSRSVSSAPTLLSNLDFNSKLSKQLAVFDQPKLIHNTSGSNLYAAVLPKNILIDVSLMWLTSTDESELHYLCSLLNSPYLFKTVYSDSKTASRHFSTKPIKTLSAPKFDKKNPSHAKLSKLSILAHRTICGVDNIKRTSFKPHISETLRDIDTLAKSVVSNRSK